MTADDKRPTIDESTIHLVRSGPDTVHTKRGYVQTECGEVAPLRQTRVTFGESNCQRCREIDAEIDGRKGGFDNV